MRGKKAKAFRKLVHKLKGLPLVEYSPTGTTTKLMLTSAGPQTYEVTQPIVMAKHCLRSWYKDTKATYKLRMRKELK